MLDWQTIAVRFGIWFLGLLGACYRYKYMPEDGSAVEIYAFLVFGVGFLVGYFVARDDIRIKRGRCPKCRTLNSWATFEDTFARSGIE